MDLKDVNDVVYFIVFFMPGFVMLKIYSLLIAREKIDVSSSVFEVIAFSCINYAFSIPILFLIFKYDLINIHPFWFVILTVFIILILPIILVKSYIVFLSSKWATKNKMLDIHKTSWDYFFSLGKTYWVIITLKNGKKVGGKFIENSFASAYPHKDIYISEVWKIDDANNKFIKKIARSAGMLILETEISNVEFKN